MRTFCGREKYRRDTWAGVKEAHMEGPGRIRNKGAVIGHYCDKANAKILAALISGFINSLGIAACACGFIIIGPNRTITVPLSSNRGPR